MARNLRLATARIATSIVAQMLKSAWLAIAGLITTVCVLGGYIIVTIQALWWPWLGKADILIPIKLAIIAGYVGSSVSHPPPDSEVGKIEAFHKAYVHEAWIYPTHQAFVNY